MTGLAAGGRRIKDLDVSIRHREGQDPNRVGARLGIVGGDRRQAFRSFPFKARGFFDHVALRQGDSEKIESARGIHRASVNLFSAGIQESQLGAGFSAGNAESVGAFFDHKAGGHKDGVRRRRFVASEREG